jgi:regulator of sigma E protease
MGFLEAIPLIGPVLSVIIPFLILLGVVVFVHEFGHYIVGRWCGIHAEVFSIGFGKRLYGWTDSRGTEWQVAALPLGGYVRFVGDMDPASAGQVDDSHLSEAERRAAFHNASLPARAATVVAGPVFNFVLSILLFAGLALAIGQSSSEPVIGEITADAVEDVGLREGDRVLEIAGEEIESFGQMLEILHRKDGEAVPAVVERGGDIAEITARYATEPRIDAITPGMPAARAGILPGDVILTLGGEDVNSFYDLQRIAAELPLKEPTELVIRRDGERMSFTLTPDTVTRPHPVTGEEVPQATLGVRSNSRGGIRAGREPVAPHIALWGGAVQTWSIIDGTVTYIGDMIFADADTSQLGGPIRIAEMSGQKAAEGATDFIWLIAVLSTSIGLLNLLPVPVLDGGHLLFYAIEAVRGRPLPGSAMQVGTVIGLSLVLSLMVFATYNDISRFIAG